MKQSFIQPTMKMLCREPQKPLTFYYFLTNLFILFFQLWTNYIRQGHQKVKMTMPSTVFEIHNMKLDYKKKL